MRKFQLCVALGFALLIASCASVKNPFTHSGLDKVEASYGIGYEGLASYRDLCAERKIASDCRLRVPKLQSAAQTAQDHLLAARDLVDNHPTISAAKAISLAQSSVTKFRTLLLQYGAQR